jgi:hypothetical protein
MPERGHPKSLAQIDDNQAAEMGSECSVRSPGRLLLLEEPVDKVGYS